MPEPIRPVPTTPIVVTGLGATPSSPGHLGRGALGEEDVAQRLGLIGIAQPQEGRALLGQSFRQRISAGAAHQAHGLDRRLLPAHPRQRLRCRLLEGFGVDGGTARSPVRRGGWPARSRAMAIAAAVRSPLTTRSTMPSDNASAAVTMRPLAISSTAAAGPARRGRRCVPPAPGTMPSFTSGRPSLASGAAMR